MTGRMESVENLSEQRRGFASQRQVFHPSHRPLEIEAIPTFPQPRRRRFSLTNLQTTKSRGHFYRLLTKLCDQRALQPTVFYRWQKEFSENGAAAFQTNNHSRRQPEQGRIERLEKKIRTKDEVLAELMAEHSALKKSLGEL